MKSNEQLSSFNTTESCCYYSAKPSLIMSSSQNSTAKSLNNLEKKFWIHSKIRQKRSVLILSVKWINGSETDSLEMMLTLKIKSKFGAINANFGKLQTKMLKSGCAEGSF